MRCNSQLVVDPANSENILTADVDGTIISEMRLLDLLNRYSIPFQEIIFRYSFKGIGLASQGRYWASFHK
ncbi:hypothetical protein HMF3257_17505 [Spirosoma telluris]|uniref:Uncharacterized protein n=2 Tax=Spirosoma telluris TaxID=2183553 RepID=A0A327NK20_9BACT|nr:hypothetical protein HMF3257_17505 [Spirosoma telluris]